MKGCCKCSKFLPGRGRTSGHFVATFQAKILGSSVYKIDLHQQRCLCGQSRSQLRRGDGQLNRFFFLFRRRHARLNQFTRKPPQSTRLRCTSHMYAGLCWELDHKCCPQNMPHVSNEKVPWTPHSFMGASRITQPSEWAREKLFRPLKTSRSEATCN